MSKNKRYAVILGSSRSEGNTSDIAKQLSTALQADYFDLNHFHIQPFCYNNNYQDDFAQLIKNLLTYDGWLFATPMYWYSASGQMKVFLDRLSDLLSYNKSQGRQLRGKTAALVATGNDQTPPNCFEDVFRLTFNYLGMPYQGMFYKQCNEDSYLNKKAVNFHSFLTQF